MPVTEIKVGAMIATLSETGETVYTRVVRNRQVTTNNASFGFRHVRLADGHAFNVTNEHILVAERPGGTLQIEQAQNIHVGDVMVTEKGGRSRVLSTDSFHLPEKWTLGTVDGTALVNGVLMTTMCDDSFLQLPKSYKQAMSVWRTEHHHLLHESTVSIDTPNHIMHSESPGIDKPIDETKVDMTKFVTV